MKKKYFFLTTLITTALSFGQTILYQETFETPANGVNYNTSVPEFNDLVNDFFIRTDGSNISADYEVMGQEGSFYFAAQDLDAEGATLPLNFTTIPIDISGNEALMITFLIAEDDAGIGQEDYDLADHVRVYSQIDGGNESLIFGVEGRGLFDTEPGPDNDLDGVADIGERITDTFNEFTAFVPGEGSLLVIRIEYSLNSSGEDLAIDNIRVTGTNVLSTYENSIKGFSFSPNPTSLSYINIKSSGASKMDVTVFDFLGKQVIKQTISNEKLDVSSLNTGIYIMKVSQGEATVTKKLIVE